MAPRATMGIVVATAFLAHGSSAWAADTEASLPGSEALHPNFDDIFDGEVQLLGFADTFVTGDGDRDPQFAGRLDAKFSIDGEAAGLWPGFSAAGHFEYHGGDNINTTGQGIIWPVNWLTAVPRQTGDKANLSLTFRQALSDRVSLTIGKFNVLDLADQAPLVGGKGRGGFQYVGIAAPPSFVFPPYVVGGQLSVRTDPVSYSLFVYDARNAQTWDVFTDPFAEGVVVNASATLPVTVRGLPGFYGLNVVHSTASGTDFASALFGPDTAAFTSTKQGYWFGAFKFQQFLHVDRDDPSRGWGVFGQVSIGDGNPKPLGMAYILGLAGNSPIAGRSADRWGVAFSLFDWSTTVKDGLAAVGSPIENEWAIEAFYEAEVTEHLRIGGNIQFIDPGTPGFANAILVGTRARVIF